MKQLLMILVVFTLLFTSCGEIAPPLNETYKDYSKINYSNNSNITNTSNITKNISSDIYVPKHNTSFFIASFNPDNFGESKSNNELLMSNYAKILDDYDLIAVQEINDETALLRFITRYLPGYDFIINKKQEQEQYAYIYKESTVEIIYTTTYPDGDELFKNNPYLARIKINDFEFITIQVNIDKINAQEEIKNLQKVVEYTRQYYNSDEIFILGSLYADCLYYTQGLYLNDYYWLIGDDKDTTTSRTHCAYDRILTIKDYGDNIVSCGVDTYVDENIIDLDLIKAMSSHYPVYCEMKI